ncbi:MAG: hypothetical protein MI864_20315 [Pseudomonadales bacterium]|uniref:Methyl-accepting chemotaxis protein n=1 Tax=Oleiphilus messinensis TaxID=141451 RepID=A0A1Y0ICK4_9GAMM|nr:hypothetical protein [Oleiphilus messinensis]ARU58292.1 methyl-accepting chemotaxis protein [Oleiphilus messinensis]MCG8612864.1 hypothetical protein [Pseudomonadales bacterium]
MSENHAEQTVAAARIASELHQAQQIARQLAISSKNARAIVLRAGSKAAGLAVIANFYDELANKTISLAKSINLTALSISTHSVTEWRNSTILEKLDLALLLAQDALHKGDIAKYIAELKLRKKELDAGFNKLMNELYGKLDEIQQHMRAIDVIAVTSKLEAVQTGEFKGHLVEMADGIQAMANKIKEHVTHSISLLDHAR